MRKLLGILWLVVGIASPALADWNVSETVPAQANGEVSVELISGSVRIVGSAANKVRVEGTAGDDVERVDVTSRGGRVSIEVELVEKNGGGTYNDGSAELEIHVPFGSRIEAEGVSADFEVRGVEGAVEVESVSGDIEIDGASREAKLATVSGDIELKSESPLRAADFTTVSGDIEVRAALGGGEYSFEAVSGDVTLHLPRNTSAEFDIKTFSGDIDNRLGPEAGSGRGEKSAKNLRFTTGGGDARVKIQSFSGDVKLLAD